MNEFTLERNRKLAGKVIAGLKSRNMQGFFAETKEEALQKALELIPEGSSVTWGGTLSISEIGLKDAVSRGNYTVYDRDLEKTPEGKEAVMRKAYTCDYYLASTNAITEDGMLVNMDRNSNRVSSLAYGPAHVILIVGMNKVRKDLEDALARVRNVAAPINAQRFEGARTPCRVNGACANCKSPDTLCCNLLITRYSRDPERMKVILVNEELGF
ncbi:lactate utilization protein [Acidaminococcus fermentans]|uniref:lactate utilization protein n=1 Tax=Acidaminococcus fermentans TaxID=905 RepID=UPI003D0552F2